ncbi:GTP-binding protein [Megamonas hypermegale]|uniref:GTP-binding protein n=1 Tax=Megamonas hypermegale TaxID=158847 RepID=UPI0026EA1C09|nr:GTP-binding protein [Megamonas hypermegale]
MKLITFAGPPSVGKTSVILRLLEVLRREDKKAGVIKFDCLTTFDRQVYEQADIPVQIGLSGKFCPDHFYISNIEEGVNWGKSQGFDYLITESAGLCNRCSPYIENILAVCVIDCLSGIQTPRKIGPMVKFADVIVVTKGDIISQAEREVFLYNIYQANPKAQVIFVNGITGQGAFMLKKYIAQFADIDGLSGARLRFTSPAAVCSYCTDEMRVGEKYQLGMTKKMEFR